MRRANGLAVASFAFVGVAVAGASMSACGAPDEESLGKQASELGADGGDAEAGVCRDVTLVALHVLAVDDEQVTARVVHALAGKDLEFRVKEVLAVRPPPPPVPAKPAEAFLDVEPDSEQGTPGEAT